jgi:hypothetical protein
VGAVAAPFRSPAVPHLRWYYGVVRLLFHPSSVAYGFPWRPSYLPYREEMGSSPGFVENPFGNMPRAWDSGDPGPPSQLRSSQMLPSAGRTALASRIYEISELILHGLLPCCVRFAPPSRPVSGNTRYRPAR